MVRYDRETRLAPRRSRGLRAGAVTLGRGGVMEWHSTLAREELLIVLSGTVRLEARSGSGTIHRRTLRRHCCAFVPSRTLHRVVNQSATRARYIYVTGSA